MSEIVEKVSKIVAEHLAVDLADIRLESSFQDDLGADSLDLVEFIMAMEEAFDIKIDDEAAQSIKTVKDAVEFIEKNK